VTLLHFQLGPLTRISDRSFAFWGRGLPQRVWLAKSQDELFQNLVFGLKPIAEGHPIAASSCVPMLVRAFLDLGLHP